MTGETETLVRGVGLAVMAIAIGVFLFRQKEGGAQLSVFNQTLAVSRESLVLFAIGVLLLVFPEINGTKKVEAASVPPKSSGDVVRPSAEDSPISSVESAPPSPSSTPQKLSPQQSPPTKVIDVDPNIVRKQWFEAVSSGDTDRIEKMVADGVVAFKTPLDDHANTALHVAAERCDATFIRYLLSKGLDPDRHNAFNDSPRVIAKERCDGKSRVLEAFGDQ